MLSSRLHPLPSSPVKRLHCRLLKTQAFFSYLNPALTPFLSLPASFSLSRSIQLCFLLHAGGDCLLTLRHIDRDVWMTNRAVGFSAFLLLFFALFFTLLFTLFLALISLSLCIYISISLYLSLSLFPHLCEIHYSSQAVKVGHTAIAFKNIREVAEACAHQNIHTQHVLSHTQRWCLFKLPCSESSPNHWLMCGVQSLKNRAIVQEWVGVCVFVHVESPFAAYRGSSFDYR